MPIADAEGGLEAETQEMQTRQILSANPLLSQRKTKKKGTSQEFLGFFAFCPCFLPKLAKGTSFEPRQNFVSHGLAQ